MSQEYEEFRAFYAHYIASGAAEAVLAMMREAGVENPRVPSFEELVASGRLQAGEMRLTALNFVDPDWSERALRTTGER